MNRFVTAVFLICGLTVAGLLAGGAEDNVMAKSEKQAWATFAGGCFWCTESDFEKIDGVTEVVSGYTGGETADPTYEQVCSGRTGHLEAIQVTYDPDKVTYDRLLDAFWRHIDPTDAGGQFVDRGSQYAPAIFYHTEEQRLAAEKSKADLEKNGPFTKPVVAAIRPAGKFYPAEDYHQNFCRTNPGRYQSYRSHSGRDQFLQRTWTAFDKKPKRADQRAGWTRPEPDDLKKRLTALQYRVTREEGTERPFDNDYWDNKREGIYVDVVSGEPLFSSQDKYDSGTGWPSFTKPLEPDNLVEREDRKLLATRVEVRSKLADSHLGHVFPDGPAPTGQRYCLNSAALRFIPKENLEREGYGEYLKLFK